MNKEWHELLIAVRKAKTEALIKYLAYLMTANSVNNIPQAIQVIKIFDKKERTKRQEKK